MITVITLIWVNGPWARPKQPTVAGLMLLISDGQTGRLQDSVENNSNPPAHIFQRVKSI